MTESLRSTRWTLPALRLKFRMTPRPVLLTKPISNMFWNRKSQTLRQESCFAGRDFVKKAREYDFLLIKLMLNDQVCLVRNHRKLIRDGRLETIKLCDEEAKGNERHSSHWLVRHTIDIGDPEWGYNGNCWLKKSLKTCENAVGLLGGLLE
ncbi:hypothetical protein CCUS01_00980 [Colletotrichum cuscutae]|uniref:Uncharacterized protein n=1 Tax=Colletotrichum cuscutae TaxID=1209917 RepID=A0AAI9V5J5_9PEZI|nr:hypothetical protein CCUS01_00980 [Colletotrichum cuscutae]